MTLKSYPETKDSGIGWAGMVPKDWDIVPLKYLVRMKSGGTPSKDAQEFWDGDIPWASAKDMKSEQLEDTADHLTEMATASGEAEMIGPGAVLVVVRGMILARTFPVCRISVAMTINQDLKAIIAGPRLRGEYLAWLLRGSATESLSRLDEAGHGTKALRMDAWTAMPLPVPSLGEQIAIAAFLDRETAKIDALVAEQERLIALLAEKRRAVISHAVTKGLDPNAPMKDSGIPWLGEVPAHWEVKPLKYLTQPDRPIMYGIVLPGENVDEGIPIVKGGDVRPHRLVRNLLNKTTAEIEAPFARARLRADDIVYSIRGSIGDAELVPDDLVDCNITQDVARISHRPDVRPRWLVYIMKSTPIFAQLEQRSLGAAIKGINIFDLKRAMIPTPPPYEQSQIEAHLDTLLGQLDMLVRQAELGIALLKERRAALISAAVTGKIDVREAVSAEEIAA